MIKSAKSMAKSHGTASGRTKRARPSTSGEIDSFFEELRYAGDRKDIVAACEAITGKLREMDNPDIQAGIKIVSKALESPLRQIVENAGVEGSIVVGKLLERSGNWGFDAQTEEYCGMDF